MQIDGLVGNIIIVFVSIILISLSYLGTIPRKSISEILVILLMSYFTCRYGLNIPIHVHTNMHLTNIIYISMFISTIIVITKSIHKNVSILKVILIVLSCAYMSIILLFIVVRMIWPSSEIMFNYGNERMTQTNFGAMSGYTYELAKYNIIVDKGNLLSIKNLIYNEHRDKDIG